MIRPKAGSFKRETVQCDKTNRLAACADAQIPMLFLQGTRDTLASLDQLEPLCKKLGRRATLKLFAVMSAFDPKRTLMMEGNARVVGIDTVWGVDPMQT